jgi:hypothetical protein
LFFVSVTVFTAAGAVGLEAKYPAKPQPTAAAAAKPPTAPKYLRLEIAFSSFFSSPIKRNPQLKF